MRLTTSNLADCFTGQRRIAQGTCEVDYVTRDGEHVPLDPRLDLFDHSPTGFEWGYQGSGPAQLALAILASVTSAEDAVRLHQDFKRDAIATIREDTWAIPHEAVAAWLRKAGAR
jgi:Family of unknown function (DUF6166)